MSNAEISSSEVAKNLEFLDVEKEDSNKVIVSESESELIKRENEAEIEIVLDSLTTTSKEDLEVQDVELTKFYWSPDKEGEEKILCFLGVDETAQIPDFLDKTKLINKPCAEFVELCDDGSLRNIISAASRLVSSFRSLQKNKLYFVKFVCAEKNKSNSYKSNVYSIKPCKIK